MTLVQGSKSVVSNIFISSLTRVFGTIIALVSVGLLTRYLGPEQFGKYSLILAFLYIFLIIGQFGLYPLLLRELSVAKDRNLLVSELFSFKFYLLFFALGSAPLISLLFPYDPIILKGVVIGAIGYFFLGLAQLFMAVFQFHLTIWGPSLAEFIGRTVQLGLIYLMVTNSRSFLEIVWVFTISSIIIFIINFYFAKRLISFKLIWLSSLVLKRIIKQAFPIAFSIILTLIYFKIDTIILSLPYVNHSSPNPANDVGIYNVAYKVLESIIFFPAMFVGLIVPFLNDLIIDNKKGFESFFNKSHSILILGLIPVVGSIFILADKIVTLIGGDQFISAAISLKIISIAIGFIFLGSLYGQTIIIEKREKKAVFIYMGGVILNIVLNLIFIPFWREAGAAFTTLLTELLITASLFIIIRKGYYFKIDWLKVLKGIIAGMALFSFLIIFKERNIFFLMAAGIFIYPSAIFLLRAVSKDEIKLFFSKNKYRPFAK